ncbi:MAG: hypothetical protein DLM56_08660 [Pseudonocardiales bacterium]|nr:MAG: hypothetical protein DLM56_08660 [Pseudonocardiales bacterium]
MPIDILTGLQMRLDAAQLRLATLDTYYKGEQPLAFLSPESRLAVGNRLDRLNSNVCRLAVVSLAERLRITGLTLDGQPDSRLWQWWLDNDLEDLSTVAFREALAFGASYAIVWAGQDGAPLVSVESARQVTLLRDPGTRDTVAALKRWADIDPVLGTPIDVKAVLYEPDTITHYQAPAYGMPAVSWELIEEVRNPLGVVPVVPLLNAETILDWQGTSEMSDVIPLCDAIGKLLIDMMVSSEYAGRPRRWATGIELEETPLLDAAGNDTGQTATANPFPDSDRMMVSEAPETKFGQLPSANLTGYRDAVGVLMAQVAAVSGMPAHYLGISERVTSADALRASEASLATRAEDRQRRFGRAWAQVAALMVAVADGVDPRSVRAGVVWADPTTASAAQEADAASKLVDAGIVTPTQAARKMGAVNEGTPA